jgi:glycosyltransferase involved in cell wall biosynthesis
MKAADCTVIVPTYNRAEFLVEALDSLLTQTWPPGQIIVVDDGSTDETPAVLGGYNGRLEVVRKPNGGKASALNAALPQVRHGAVWIFDDDDIALPDGLERHLKALNGCGSAGFTISSMLIGRGAPGTPLEQTGRLAPRGDA